MLVEEPELCGGCGKFLEQISRSRWCSTRCKAREWLKGEYAKARAFLALPLATLPEELEAQLPQGERRLWTAYAFILRSRAPAYARGYRIGTIRKEGQRMRWFPRSGSGLQPMFRLEPFELPIGPLRGRYAVVFTDQSGEPIDEPSFTIEIGFRDKHVLFSEGDLSFRPRLRSPSVQAHRSR